MTDPVEDELAELELGSTPPESSSETNSTIPEPSAVAPPPRATLDGRRRALLGLTVFAMTVLWAAPLALGLWLMALIFAPGVSGELLEASDGLRPTTFGGAVWIAAAALLMALVAGMRRALRRYRDPEVRRGLVGRPGLVLTVGATMTALGLVGWESTGTDLPDTMVAAAIVLATAAWLAVLPVQLGALVWRTGRRAWRSRHAGPYRAGLWTGLTAGLALASALNWPFVWPVDGDRTLNDLLGDQIELVLDSVFDAAEHASSDEGVAAVRTTLAVTSERLYISSSSGFAAMATGRFESCVHELMGGDDGRSRRDIAIRRLMGSGTSPTTAQDIAQDAVIAACEAYAEGRVREIAPWFNKVVNNMARDEYRRWGRRACQIEARPSTGFQPSPDHALYLQQVRAAMCSLETADQHVLELVAEGFAASEVAERLEISHAAARKRISRARRRLKRALKLI